MPDRRSTLLKVAQEAGVSLVTASRILNSDYAPVYRKAKERAKHVRSVAAKLGYRTNAAAKATATGRFGCVTLLAAANSAEVGFFPGVATGLIDELGEHSYKLMLSRVIESEIVPGALPSALRDNMSDGVLLNYGNMVPDRTIALVESYRIPLICMNIKRHADCVFPDDFSAARDVTKGLIEVGHRRIVYLLTFDQPHYSAADRRDGYLAAMKKASLAPLVLERLDHDEMMRRLYAMFKGRGRPTAVVGYDLGSTEATLEVAGGLGLRVPQDVSVVQFSHDNMVGGKRYSNLWLPWYEVARAAARELLEKIEDPERSFPPLAIMPKFDLDPSIAPCSK